MQGADLRRFVRTWVLHPGGFAGEEAEVWFSNEFLAALAQQADRERLTPIDGVVEHAGTCGGKGRKKDR